MRLSDYEKLLQEYGGLIANRKGMFIKDSLLPRSRDKIKEAFFSMTQHILIQKDINWETLHTFASAYSFLPHFIEDNLAEKYNQIWGKLQDDKDFVTNNVKLVQEFKKFLSDVLNKSVMFQEEILDYIGTFTQGEKFKEDVLKKMREAKSSRQVEQ